MDGGASITLIHWKQVDLRIGLMHCNSRKYEPLSSYNFFSRNELLIGEDKVTNLKMLENQTISCFLDKETDTEVYIEML